MNAQHTNGDVAGDWNQPYVAARMVQGRPLVVVNPAVFKDGVSGSNFAEQVAVSVNSLLDVAEVYVEDGGTLITGDIDEQKEAKA